MGQDQFLEAVPIAYRLEGLDSAQRVLNEFYTVDCAKREGRMGQTRS
jgi:hypothetical protein